MDMWEDMWGIVGIGNEEPQTRVYDWWEGCVYVYWFK